MKTSKITIFIKPLVLRVLVYIYDMNLKKKNTNFKLLAWGSPFEKLKNLKESENSSCSKVPDVCILNDCI